MEAGDGHRSGVPRLWSESSYPSRKIRETGEEDFKRGIFEVILDV